MADGVSGYSCYEDLGNGDRLDRGHLTHLPHWGPALPERHAGFTHRRRGVPLDAEAAQSAATRECVGALHRGRIACRMPSLGSIWARILGFRVFGFIGALLARSVILSRSPDLLARPSFLFVGGALQHVRGPERTGSTGTDQLGVTPITTMAVAAGYMRETSTEVGFPPSLRSRGHKLLISRERC